MENSKQFWEKIFWEKMMIAVIAGTLGGLLALIFG